jgi:phage terminase large subunit
VDDGIEWLKSLDIVVHPRCKHMADELSLYRYKTDSATDRVLPILEDKHNHLIDALRYSQEGVRRAHAQKPQIAAPLPVASKW